MTKWEERDEERGRERETEREASPIAFLSSFLLFKIENLNFALTSAFIPLTSTRYRDMYSLLSSSRPRGFTRRHLCVCGCHVCISVCTCMVVYVHMGVYVLMYVHMGVYVLMYAHMGVYVLMYVHMGVYVLVCMCICVMYVRMYMCVYMCTYMCMYCVCCMDYRYCMLK